MAKNLIVTVSGYVQDIKNSKVGEYAVIRVDKKKKDGEQWVTVDKHYFNIALEQGHNVAKDDLYEVTGELDISKWKDDKGETQISLWVKKSQWKHLAKVQKSETFQNGWGAQAVDNLLDSGATPF